MSRGERMVPFKWDGGRMEEGWRESFVGITNDMAIEFLRLRVAVCEGAGSWFIVRGGGWNFRVYLGIWRLFVSRCGLVVRWVSDGWGLKGYCLPFFWRQHFLTWRR